MCRPLRPPMTLSPDATANVLAVVPALLSLGGMVYAYLALLGARDFGRSKGVSTEACPGVNLLKPLKGLDARMYAGFASHCVQQYAGPIELLFGVTSLEDAAIADVARLRVEFPEIAIRVVACPERLGWNGKVSTLAQLLPHATFEHVVVNDSDIAVGPGYLRAVMSALQSEGVGLVTVPYRGIAAGNLWSRLEALGIATDFLPGVLTARKLEGGIRFGLGSTLATTKRTLAAIGGFESLVDELADDYVLGARIVAAGMRVELINEPVATSVPAYSFRGFYEHQMRWARGVRDSRRAGYMGLCVTHVLPWAFLCVIASGGALWSFSVLSMALLLRVAVALQVGVGLLRDGQVLRDLLLLPLRDFFALAFWAWSFASDDVVWRGERFRLKRGVLERIP